jgi:hypothetical protein
MEGHRQPNLGTIAVNRKDGELFGRVLNQFKIRWAIMIIKRSRWRMGYLEQSAVLQVF